MVRPDRAPPRGPAPDPATIWSAGTPSLRSGSSWAASGYSDKRLFVTEAWASTAGRTPTSVSGSAVWRRQPQVIRTERTPPCVLLVRSGHDLVGGDPVVALGVQLSGDMGVQRGETVRDGRPLAGAVGTAAVERRAVHDSGLPSMVRPDWASPCVLLVRSGDDLVRGDAAVQLRVELGRDGGEVGHGLASSGVTIVCPVGSDRG